MVILLAGRQALIGQISDAIIGDTCLSPTHGRALSRVSLLLVRASHQGHVGVETLERGNGEAQVLGAGASRCCAMSSAGKRPRGSGHAFATAMGAFGKRSRGRTSTFCMLIYTELLARRISPRRGSHRLASSLGGAAHWRNVGGQASRRRGERPGYPSRSRSSGGLSVSLLSRLTSIVRRCCHARGHHGPTFPRAVLRASR
jgi:hypothetical protein